jgi:leucyl aminopeptidase
MRVSIKTGDVTRSSAELPANELSPATLASRARRVAREVGLASRVMGPSELSQRKMRGLLAVGRGSAHPPRLVVEFLRSFEPDGQN